MPKNGWTKADVLRLYAFYRKEGHVVTCNGDRIDICFDPTHPGLDLWEQGEKAWTTPELEDLAHEAAPSFTFRDDRYDIVHHLEDANKSGIKVKKVTSIDVDWQRPVVKIKLVKGK